MAVKLTDAKLLKLWADICKERAVELINRLLGRKNLNKAGFARELGISRALLNHYLHHPTLKSIEIIAAGLKIKPKRLIL